MPPFELPKDDDGTVLPHDHPELVDPARVIRRIHSDYVVDDDNNGGQRLSSALFKHDSRNGNAHLSFDSEACIIAKGDEPATYVTTDKFFGSLIIPISDLRSVDSAIVAEDVWKIGMVPVRGNDCHAGLWGKVTKGQSNALERLSVWLVEIPGVRKQMPETNAA